MSLLSKKISLHYRNTGPILWELFVYSLCTSLALRHTVQSTSMPLSTLWLSNKLLKKLSIKRHSFASSSSGASWVETNSKPKCGGGFGPADFFSSCFLHKGMENNWLLFLLWDHFVCGKALQVLYFLLFQLPRSRFCWIAARWVSLCVCTFTPAASRQVMACSSAEIHPVDLDYSFNLSSIPVLPFIGPSQPAPPPPPRPRLISPGNFIAKQFLKAAAENTEQTWTLDSHWKYFPRKLSDFDTELNVLRV